MSRTVSIIVPVYNEAVSIEQKLEALLSYGANEICVVDGGSVDDTWAKAQKFPIKVLSSEKGRACQMNTGARHTFGEILLFLHCDVSLPEKALCFIRGCFEETEMIAGRFRLKFDEDSFLNRIHSWGTQFHRFSFGDQGFFVLREHFEALGGFDEKAFFEDVDLYRRLRNQGSVHVFKDKFVIACSRRYQKVGATKQRMINTFLLLMGTLNIDPRPLMKHIYKDIR